MVVYEGSTARVARRDGTDERRRLAELAAQGVVHDHHVAGVDGGGRVSGHDEFLSWAGMRGARTWRVTLPTSRSGQPAGPVQGGVGSAAVAARVASESLGHRTGGRALQQVALFGLPASRQTVLSTPGPVNTLARAGRAGAGVRSAPAAAGCYDGPVQNATPAQPGPLGRASAGARATLAPRHPVARALTWATMSSALSSGLFYTVSALYLTRAVGLSATTVGVGLTIAGAVGVAGSFAAGHLADRLGARRVLLLATLGQGLALVGYALVSSTLPFVLVACAAVGLRSMQGTARQAVLARGFTGADRVDVRARLRVVTNVFIGLGTVVAGAALLLDTAAAYRTTVVLAGLLVLASCVPLLRLARSSDGVDQLTADQPDGAAPVSRGRSPLRDRRYLTLTALNAVLAMHFGLQTVGVPLWVATRTEAPEVTVSGLLVLNTVLVALFQVRAARGTDDVRTAGRAVVRSGVALAAACALYAAAGSRGALVAVALLVAAAVAHSVGEMWSEAGSWGLAFELADPLSAGAYQGVSQTGYSLGAMLAPLVVTATAIDHGAAGWAVLGAAFLGAAALTGVVAHRAGGRLPAVVA